MIKGKLYFDSTAQFINDYKKYLSDNGISNVFVARKLGISPQNLQGLFRKKELTVRDLVRLCDAIGYNVELHIYRPYDG